MYPSPDPRIYCLLQSARDHPALAAGIAPVGLLSPSEQVRYEGFRGPKRRRDWLLGRWTAKHLIQSYLSLTGDELLAFDRIEILAGEDGAPFARLDQRLHLSLSISHTGSESLCAICDSDAGHVGADVEQIEPREASFVRTFFTPAEIAAIGAAPGLGRDALIAGLWSVKEAILKTLRVGLRADTRQVSVQLDNLASQWNPAKVSVDPVLLSSPSATLTAWCQVRPSRVLSLALLAAS
jgi:4'-phosphopantetheinyl transferase